MGTYPKDPALAVARVIKDHDKKIRIILSRLDQTQSDRSKDASGVATNTTAITAIGTGTGGTTAQNFVGKLATAAVASPGAGGTTQADFLASLVQVVNYTETASGGWSTGGALQAGSWDATHANALVPWMNQVVADLGAILTALRNAGIMS